MTTACADDGFAHDQVRRLPIGFHPSTNQSGMGSGVSVVNVFQQKVHDSASLSNEEQSGVEATPGGGGGVLSFSIFCQIDFESCS